MKILSTLWRRALHIINQHGHTGVAVLGLMSAADGHNAGLVVSAAYLIVLGYDANKWRRYFADAAPYIPIGIWAMEAMDSVNAKRALLPKPQWIITRSQQYDRDGQRYFVTVSDTKITR